MIIHLYEGNAVQYMIHVHVILYIDPITLIIMYCLLISSAQRENQVLNDLSAPLVNPSHGEGSSMTSYYHNDLNLLMKIIYTLYNIFTHVHRT